jgi:quinoprotein dehydrogenase-associated probable ABC transporter substrate-binding protein
MCSRFPRLAAVLVLALVGGGRARAAAGSAATPPQSELRFCADPNNLPFSNQRMEGFENEIARWIARDLGATPKFVWWAQRRGFFRNTLQAGLCDVVVGVPFGFERALTTKPYYRSTYVFVRRADSSADVRSLDDSRLRTLRVGVQLVGDDGVNTPPAHALTRRGIVENVRGYTLYGDYSEPNPPARIVDAVAKGDVDVALVWGPLAGYFAKREGVPLVMTPVSPSIDLPFLPFVYDISVGVRRGQTELRDRIDAVLERRHADIRALLDRYGVPRAPEPAAADAAAPGGAP